MLRRNSKSLGDQVRLRISRQYRWWGHVDSAARLPRCVQYTATALQQLLARVQWKLIGGEWTGLEGASLSRSGHNAAHNDRPAGKLSTGDGQFGQRTWAS